MPQPFTRVMLVLTTLMGMTSAARETGRERHITLSSETPHEVHVAAGTATVLLFDSPVLPSSLTLGASHERFERIDLTERALILLPRLALAPHERIPLTLRFADGRLPSRATFTLTSGPGEVDLQVRVFRAALAPEARTAPARCEDSGRFSNGATVEKLSPRLPSGDSPPRIHVVDLRARTAPGFMALEVALLLAAGQPGWTPGPVEVLDEETSAPVPVHAVDLDVSALQPGVPGRLVLELRPPPATERVRIRVHEQGGSRTVQLKDVRLPGPGVTP